MAMNEHWWSARGPIRRPSRSSTGAAFRASMALPTAAPAPSRSPRTSPRRPSSALCGTCIDSSGSRAGSALGVTRNPSANELVDHYRRTGRAASPRSVDAARGLMPEAWPDPADAIDERDTVDEALAAMERLTPH